jgi:NADP-dependent 3-hydroxy acid dehydrogenase YdfG
MKTAIVTGASRGVGRATVKLLESSGYRVIAASRDLDAMKDLESENVEVNKLDVTDEESIESFCKKYEEYTIDLLVHNAGGGAGPTYLIYETMENFRRAYDINVGGPMYISQLLIPSMMKSDSPTIIFISSLCGQVPFRGSGNYSNAKRGQMGLVDTMRLEFPQYGITVTEICPGTIDTQTEKKDHALTAEDMAEAIRWVGSLPSHVNINHLEIAHINGSKYVI